MATEPCCALRRVRAIFLALGFEQPAIGGRDVKGGVPLHRGTHEAHLDPCDDVRDRRVVVCLVTTRIDVAVEQRDRQLEWAGRHRVPRARERPEPVSARVIRALVREVDDDPPHIVWRQAVLADELEHELDRRVVHAGGPVRLELGLRHLPIRPQTRGYLARVRRDTIEKAHEEAALAFKRRERHLAAGLRGDGRRDAVARDVAVKQTAERVLG